MFSNKILSLLMSIGLVMISKLKKIFLPPTISFFMILAIVWVIDKNSIHEAEQGPQIEIPLFNILLVPFLFAIVFQIFCVLPFREKIRVKKKIVGLLLWQFGLVVSLFFGLILVIGYSLFSKLNLSIFFDCLFFSGLFSVYWITNFFILSFIDNINNKLVR